MQPVSGKEQHTSTQLLLFITNTFCEEETILNQVLQHNDELLKIWNNDLNQTTERSHH
ncbi:hypothetical protein H6G00_06350 [Leptolyngbya sp. FACHB-541]|uniref:hypothetical protein n=1 Tax=Leptolyngbya sp. FACHB-541 TaxID=2692810 RepID=UPI001681F561|nr:hypothetical protein [Leptolyngbya sp. FACHB-541]MBD1996239.1 hypothetical protein [Leptolyngbya sp. FACHB-541]